MAFALSRNAHGKLVFMSAAGVVTENVAAVRAFPISDPGGGIALVDAQGHELIWIADLAAVPAAARALIEADLGAREFMPEIEAILTVARHASSSTWQVQTNRGRTSFMLRGEDDIRRLGNGSLLIADDCGIHYLIRDPRALDRASRKILDRFF
jgi:hypothetical protein